VLVQSQRRERFLIVILMEKQVMMVKVWSDEVMKSKVWRERSG
jgi:hypothetical protein